MFDILAGIGLFIATIGIANFYKLRTGESYSSFPLGFFCWFIIWIVAIYILFTPDPYIILALGAISLVYVLLFWLWHSLTNKKLCKAETIPVAFREMSAPTLLSSVPKVAEVLLQDIAVWFVVGGLYKLELPIPFVVIILAVVVWIVHLPGIKLFGPVYGRYFLYSATSMSVFVPIFYLFGTIGFLLLYVLHLCVYLFMYLYFSRKM